jgi:hypothetical protein
MGILGRFAEWVSLSSRKKLVSSDQRTFRTLQKIHGCLRSHLQLGKIKLFFKQSEIALELQKCELEVQQNLGIYKVGCILVFLQLK